MNLTICRALAVFFVLSALSHGAAAQDEIPRFLDHDRLVVESIDGPLAETVFDDQFSGWIGWSVPIVPGTGSVCCCWSGRSSWRTSGVCSLDGGRGWCHGDGIESGGGDELFIFARVESGRSIAELVAVDEACRLDAAGATVRWLGRVDPAESVRLLVEASPRGSSRSLAAVALHDEPSATDHLRNVLETSGSRSVRRDAAFWLGSTRGPAGFEILDLRSRHEQAAERELVVFPLSQSEVREAGDRLRAMATDDPAGDVRKEALFWLAERGAPEAEALLRRALTTDRDRDVRRHAVFAISQLPDGRGVSTLIELARSNASDEIRQQAFFWLAQSGDDAALSFFDDVLSDR